MATRDQTIELIQKLQPWVEQRVIAPARLMALVGRTRQVWYFWKSGHTPMSDSDYELMKSLLTLLEQAPKEDISGLISGDNELIEQDGRFVII